MFELTVRTKALKVTATLDPEDLLGVRVPDQPRIRLRLQLPSQVVTAEVNAQSLRKVVAAIEASAPDSLVVVVQGELEGGAIVEAGISAVSRVPKLEPAAA